METNIEYPAADRILSHGRPVQRTLGLPIARVVPQDIHSVFDYIGALVTTLAGLRADTAPARLAAMSLGVSTLGVSLLTDYRLSVWKLIPIEVHEALDYTVGLANVASPFVLGYRSREPLVSTIQIAGGIADLIVSLFTDYRAYRGRGARIRR